ncbi:integrase core domain protein [Trichuris suis]|nr:integrase core domain protein [Trichuris suis]
MDLVHSDLCGPMPTPTPSGDRCMLTLIDDHSRFTMVRLIKSKGELARVIKAYVARMKNRFGRKPIAFRTDNGKEYVGQELKSYFEDEGIEHQTTVSYTAQQNGLAERKNRSLTEIAKCMLLDAGLQNRFWGEAVRTAAYLQNHLPSRSVGKTPCEHFLGVKPT